MREDREDGLMARRTFVGGALATGMALGALASLGQPGSAAYAQDVEAAVIASASVDESAGNAQYGFLIKVRNCIDCKECVKACRLWNRIPESVPARRKITPHTAESGKEVYLSTSCMHCEHPSCASVCPAGAISKGDGGVVVVDSSRCIGCKYCYQACPYGVPNYRVFGMDKCDCCLGNGVPLGETPHCVQACKVGALHYGRLEDLLVQAGETARLVDGENGPSCVLA